jgi:fucose 4-O-acetylase-like acetyltransferase
VDLVPDLDLSAPSPGEPARPRRELYIDAFRGLMALVMVQGHLFESLLRPVVRAEHWYTFQLMFHGSTAPGFLFASGFVAGLPRAPLSLRASLRRARRLLFVLGVGYFLHLPWLSVWKTANEASPRQREILFSCDALQVIAVTQLFVILLQWVSGRRWTRVAALVALAVVAAAPSVWASGIAASWPEALAPYLDRATGSRFPVFPYAAFVLAGTLAGATLGRVEPDVRRRRALAAGSVLIGLGAALAWALAGRVDYWGPSPAYVLVRLGGLLLLLLAVEGAARAAVPGMGALGLLGHETLLVYVLHLYLLFGGIATGPALMQGLHGRLGLGQALVALVSMLPVLLAAAWLWRRTRQRSPGQTQLLLVFVTTFLVYEFLTRPW